MQVVQKSISLEVDSADEQIVGGFISTSNRDRLGYLLCSVMPRPIAELAPLLRVRGFCRHKKPAGAGY